MKLISILAILFCVSFSEAQITRNITQSADSVLGTTTWQTLSIGQFKKIHTANIITDSYSASNVRLYIGFVTDAATDTSTGRRIVLNNLDAGWYKSNLNLNSIMVRTNTGTVTFRYILNE